LLHASNVWITSFVFLYCLFGYFHFLSCRLSSPGCPPQFSAQWTRLTFFVTVVQREPPRSSFYCFLNPLFFRTPVPPSVTPVGKETPKKTCLHTTGSGRIWSRWELLCLIWNGWTRDISMSYMKWMNRVYDSEGLREGSCWLLITN
jgi:hypothetical protein